MMRDFLADNRKDLIERCRTRTAQRPAREATPQQLQNGVPMFLDQLITMLDAQQLLESIGGGQKITGSTGGEVSNSSQIGKSAARHGQALFALGYSIEQVVHDYGDLCQSIMDLACESDTQFPVGDFRTLNGCLDNAIADAATEFSYQRDLKVSKTQALEMGEQFGIFVEDLRSQIGTAALAFAAARTGGLSLSGATGTLLERSLVNLQKLINVSMTDVLLRVDKHKKSQFFALADFIAEVRDAMNSDASGYLLTILPLGTEIYIRADRALLFSAIDNLLKNAFKFPHGQAEVTLNAYSAADRVFIDIVGHCGGQSQVDAEEMLAAVVRPDRDQSQVESGLSLVKRSVEENDGVLSVRNTPGLGCIFTISLARYASDET